MDWKDYEREVLEDAKECIEENAKYFDTWDEMYDELFLNDSVTGNGSGSYTFCAATARENVEGIIFDDDAIEAFREYGYEGIPTEKGPEGVDVIARCIALGYVSGELEEHFDEVREAA